MKQQKILGLLQILLAISVLIGFTIPSMIYWYVFDVAVILLGLYTGVYLIKITKK